jgi:L-cysteine desulfidase
MSYTVKDVLRMEVAPALGCTEPGAVALGAAAAAALLEPESMTEIEVWVDANVYKNGLAVSIPGAPGLSGLATASALGAIGGDAARKLEVLAPLDAASIAKAQALVSDDAVTVALLPEQAGPYIRTIIHGRGRADGAAHIAESIIQGAHDNIVALSLDGVPVTDSPLLSLEEIAGHSAGQSLSALEAWLRERSLAELLAMVEDLDAEDLAFIEEGVQTNIRLAEVGLKEGAGLGVGRALERLARQGLIQRDMILAARILTSSAADARMAGAKLPAMSSAGSGNHGLTAILPIWAVRDYVDCEPIEVLKAIALSHIVTGFIKAYTGRLSALCGCSIAAGAGATAGIAYLLGGDTTHIAGAITNLMGDLAGVICDGAKAGCALKLSTAAGTAVQAALFALQGVTVNPTDGIVDCTPEKTMQNVGTLSTQGMIATDRTILQIMMAKEFGGE